MKILTPKEKIEPKSCGLLGVRGIPHYWPIIYWVVSAFRPVPSSANLSLFRVFPYREGPYALSTNFWNRRTVLSDSKKGLCDDTFFKPFFRALLSIRRAFGPPKASKMSKRLLKFQTRHNFSLHPVLQFLLRASLATFSTDQLKSA